MDRGRIPDGGYRIWIPASLVYINYHQEAFRGEPQTHFVQYAGIACGATRNSAIISGLLELIERDAVAIWWGADVPLPALNVRRYPRLRSYVEPIQADSPVSFKWFPIPNDSGIPVIGSLLHDSRQHIVCMGFAARFSAEEAALKAAAEAAQSYHIALDLLDPDSPTWNAIQQGILNDKALKPYRADRSYRSAFRDDYRDMVDLYLNSQYYMDPATHTEISSLLNAEETAMLPADAAIPATMEALVHQLSSLDLGSFLRGCDNAGYSRYRTVCDQSDRTGSCPQCANCLSLSGTRKAIYHSLQAWLDNGPAYGTSNQSPSAASQLMKGVDSCSSRPGSIKLF